MLQPTARSASRLMARVPAQRLVRCAGEYVGGLPLHARRFWATSRREGAMGGSGMGNRMPATSSSVVSPSDSAPLPATSSDDLPWYLKVDVPRHAALAAAEEVVLPAIPTGAPAMMEPLLTFAAHDLGLDGLQLLDLRQLEPAAALGPDLLMVFGTARSERHLHVSADRLVRWLRRYGIHATADGLLGRNELKIKLRRKARRAKLLGNNTFAAQLGGGGEPAVDDGISTQWVCLNAGTIGRAGEEGGVVDAAGRTTGFGSVLRSGTTVVVQMFTEAKRRQLDLETLWTRTLSRSLRRKEEEEGGSLGGEAAGKRQDHKTHAVFEQHFQQRRFFATSARRPAVSSEHDVLMLMRQPSLQPADLDSIARQLNNDHGSSSSANRTRLLHELAQHLQRLPRAEVAEMLGLQSGAGLPTQFARTATFCMRGMTAAETWPFRSAVHATALRAGHADYSLDGLAALVDEMQRSGVALPREQALHLVRAVLSVWRGSSVKGEAETTARQQTDVVMAVVDTLHERGEAVLANDVLVTAIGALTEGGGRLEMRDHDTRDQGSLQHRLEQLLRDLTRTGRLPCPDEAQTAALLSSYAAQDDWPRFWTAWRLRPQHGLARSAQLYAHALGRVARSQQRARCEQALRWCFHEMAHEHPPVQPAGAVLAALRACVRVADPQAEALVRNRNSGDYNKKEDPRLRRLASRDFVRMLQMAEAM
ncbi:hypothetical protein CMQ_3567 [Grosmannia clavigera kw1407]|uniref:ATPase synthesis protein 25 n=1 Tax=Grosmannia clavigera (strain kw1407 / UAMH 11150) TaxID=655863 RepID=F0X894_GROCL|nr:uncharacterized protein CMQ_3567 [Grosmannia clavigera kw1407]EFX05498.1 hypothetical protein CMQ_3567 [Grosmannia clavigera kw1407]